MTAQLSLGEIFEQGDGAELGQLFVSFSHGSSLVASPFSRDIAASRY